MISRQYRPVVWGAGILLGVWLLAWAGLAIAENMKVTADKVAAYMDGNDLSKLTGDARKRAIKRLAEMINALTPEERRKFRLQRMTWFEAMTDAEKGEFIDATMPTGFKQMIAGFEQLPEEQRKRVVADSVKRMKEAREKLENGELDPSQMQPPGSEGGNRPADLSPELQKKVITTGLSTFYGQSSAQAKAELAPLLEEMQRSMERGAAFRGQRRPNPNDGGGQGR